MTKCPDPEAAESAAKLAAGLTTAIAIYLYFGGWLYAGTMYWGFGLPLSSVDIPTYYLISYSYSVFGTSFGGALLFSGIAIGWYVLARYHLKRWQELLLTIVMVTLPFYFISLLATHRAQLDAARLRNGEAKVVRLSIKESVRDHYTADFLAMTPTGDLRLLLLTKERVYVFHQPEGSQGMLPNAILYVVPEGDTSLAIELPSIRE